MSKAVFISAEEVSKELGISKAHAYKMIRGWNKELGSKGFLIIAGRVNRQYYREKLYGSINCRQEESDYIASI